MGIWVQRDKDLCRLPKDISRVVHDGHSPSRAPPKVHDPTEDSDSPPSIPSKIGLKSMGGVMPLKLGTDSASLAPGELLEPAFPSSADSLDHYVLVASPSTSHSLSSSSTTSTSRSSRGRGRVAHPSIRDKALPPLPPSSSQPPSPPTRNDTHPSSDVILSPLLDLNLTSLSPARPRPSAAPAIVGCESIYPPNPIPKTTTSASMRRRALTDDVRDKPLPALISAVRDATFPRMQGVVHSVLRAPKLSKIRSNHQKTEVGGLLFSGSIES